MPTNPELATRILDVIARARRLPPGFLTLDKTFEELNIDSLDGINLIFELESAFDISIPDEAAREIRSIRELVDGVTTLVCVASPES